MGRKIRSGNKGGNQSIRLSADGNARSPTDQAALPGACVACRTKANDGIEKRKTNQGLLPGRVHDTLPKANQPLAIGWSPCPCKFTRSSQVHTQEFADSDDGTGQGGTDGMRIPLRFGIRQAGRGDPPPRPNSIASMSSVGSRWYYRMIRGRFGSGILPRWKSRLRTA